MRATHGAPTHKHDGAMNHPLLSGPLMALLNCVLQAIKFVEFCARPQFLGFD